MGPTVPPSGARVIGRSPHSASVVLRCRPGGVDVEPDAVVDDLDRDLAIRVGDRDADVPGAGMLDHVREVFWTRR